MPAIRSVAGLEEEDDELDESLRPGEVQIPPSSGEVDEPRGPATFEQAEVLNVVVPKETDTTRIGIGLRPDMPDRAVVHTIASGTPAVGIIEPYDELLVVAGERVSSAVHAVQLIREFPAGDLHIELKRAPELSAAARSVQEGMRNALASREGLVRRTLHKESLDSVLGLSFSPEYHVHSVIKLVKEGGLAAEALAPGDLVKRLNGIECSAPADTAKHLRESSGRIELLVVPSHKVDLRELHDVEEEAAAARQQQEEAYRARERAEQEAAEGAEGARRPREAAGYASDDYADEGEEGEGEEDFSDDDEDDYDESERARMNSAAPPRPAYTSRPTGGGDSDGSPPRPAAVAVGHARRLPASLSGLSPAGPPSRGAPPVQASPHPDPGVTSGTRMGGPPLAKGGKPQGWREWLQQRKGAAATVPAPNSPRANHPGVQRAEELQRV